MFGNGLPIGMQLTPTNLPLTEIQPDRLPVYSGLFGEDPGITAEKICGWRSATKMYRQQGMTILALDVLSLLPPNLIQYGIRRAQPFGQISKLGKANGF